MLHFASYHRPRLRMLSEEQVRDIHLATLEILERTGVEVKDARALELLRQAGARISGQRAHIPAALVEQAIRRAPERVVIADRLGRRVMPLEEGKVFFGTGSDTPSMIDPRTGEHRPPRRRDVVDFARLVDALPNLDFAMSMGIVSDAPVMQNYVQGFAAMVEGTSKPIVYTANNVGDLEQIHRMAIAVAGGEEALRANPFLVLYAEPISPLTHSPDGLGKLLYCAEHRLPVAYVSGTMAGATVPVTLAGAIAITNAECLSGLVIHQLVAPGAPFIYGANVSVIDMTTSACVYGGPEWRLADAAYADLARFYKLPVWAAAGNTDAKTVDAQAGAEALFSLAITALAQCNLVHDVGYIDSGLTSSMELTLLSDELIQMLRIFVRGIPTDPERLALEVIDEVGPGGHFLDTDHTVKHFRREHFLPKLMERRNYEGWVAGGSKDTAARLNARVLEILAEHQPAPLPQAAQQTITQVLATRGN